VQGVAVHLRSLYCSNLSRSAACPRLVHSSCCSREPCPALFASDDWSSRNKTAWRGAMAVVTQPQPRRLLEAVLQTESYHLPGGWPGPLPNTGRLFSQSVKPATAAAIATVVSKAAAAAPNLFEKFEE
jgi:hypothetical protein